MKLIRLGGVTSKGIQTGLKAHQNEKGEGKYIHKDSLLLAQWKILKL